MKKKSVSLAKKSIFGGIDQEIYKKISINDLILFCIYSISEKKEKCGFERLMKECFNLFPLSFNFSSISKWPDSRKLDRTLRSLRAKKLIRGNPQTIFFLTNQGRKIAQETVKTFGQRKLKL